MSEENDRGVGLMPVKPVNAPSPLELAHRRESPLERLLAEKPESQVPIRPKDRSETPAR